MSVACEIVFKKRNKNNPILREKFVFKTSKFA
jgi:hypothetical protein